ncbi:MAG: cupin domain-containing protein, partial [Hungatella sp.]
RGYRMSYFFKEADTSIDTVESGKCMRRIKGHDGKLMTVEVYFEHGCISAAHIHPHEQMTYCLEGEFEFYVGEETGRMKAGDTVYMPPNILHNCKLLSEKGRLLDIFTPVREDFLA